MAADTYASVSPHAPEEGGQCGAGDARSIPLQSSRPRWKAAVVASAAVLGVAAAVCAVDGGLRAAQTSRSQVKDEEWTFQCPGNIGVEGYGGVMLTNAGTDTPGVPTEGFVEAKDGNTVVAHLGGRAYFSDSCVSGSYDPNRYIALNLLGKTLRYTTDVSGAGCGCNAALYLVPMKQNDAEGQCGGDFYCDANKVCGVPCAEIDIQEANMYSWFSTLHLWDDGRGYGFGYGGDMGLPLRRDWTSEEYGPGAKCIDTNKPFEVAMSFPVDAQGALKGMEGTLSQGNCSVSGKVDRAQQKNIRNRIFTGKERMGELTEGLQKGMTLVVSYWSSEEMTWMDGPGEDKKGPPCPKGADDPGKCAESSKFWDIRVEKMKRKSATRHHVASTTTTIKTTTSRTTTVPTTATTTVTETHTGTSTTTPVPCSGLQALVPWLLCPTA